MMNTVKEVSRGVQTSVLVRKTTVKTGQNQTPIAWIQSTNVVEGLEDISARLTASFFPSCSVPDPFPTSSVLAASRNQMCIQKGPIRGVQGHGKEQLLTGIHPAFFSTQLPLHVRPLPTLQGWKLPRALVPLVEMRPTG